MMSTPPLVLTQEHATRLISYLQRYRRYLLTQVAPSAERNTIQRVLQTLQGKLIHTMDTQVRQQGVQFHFALNSEEVKVLKAMVADLLTLTVREAPSEQRDATLVDLTSLKTAVEKIAISGQRNHFTSLLL